MSRIVKAFHYSVCPDDITQRVCRFVYHVKRIGDSLYTCMDGSTEKPTLCSEVFSKLPKDSEKVRKKRILTLPVYRRGQIHFPGRWPVLPKLSCFLDPHDTSLSKARTRRPMTT